MARWALLLLSTWTLFAHERGSASAHWSIHALGSTVALAPSPFRNGRTIVFPDGEAITLLTFKPIRTRNLTWYPGGPPLRPPHGYEVVETRWAVRNTTEHVIEIKTWRATSRGRTSAMFITGNAGEPGLVPSGKTQRYHWMFIVAKTGRVVVHYGRFHAHWLPRG
jgi:hypothetical protein